MNGVSLSIDGESRVLETSEPVRSVYDCRAGNAASIRVPDLGGTFRCTDIDDKPRKHTSRTKLARRAILARGTSRERLCSRCAHETLSLTGIWCKPARIAVIALALAERIGRFPASTGKTRGLTGQLLLRAWWALLAFSARHIGVTVHSGVANGTTPLWSRARIPGRACDTRRTPVP